MQNKTIVSKQKIPTKKDLLMPCRYIILILADLKSGALCCAGKILAGAARARTRELSFVRGVKISD